MGCLFWQPLIRNPYTCCLLCFSSADNHYTAFCFLHLTIYPLIHIICSPILSPEHLPFVLPFSASCGCYISPSAKCGAVHFKNIEERCLWGTHRNMRGLQWHCRIQSLHVVTLDVVQAVEDQWRKRTSYILLLQRY